MPSNPQHTQHAQQRTAAAHRQAGYSARRQPLKELPATPAQARAASEAVFELGDRAGILGHVKDMPMIPHMAEYEGKKFPYEVGGGQRHCVGLMQGCTAWPQRWSGTSTGRQTGRLS